MQTAIYPTPVPTRKETPPQRHRLWLLIVAFAFLWISSSDKASAGAVLRLYYDGVPGTSVADLRNAAVFPNFPTFYEVLTEFLEGVENEGDLYGALIRGYIEAPQTGNYIFWIASDDDAELWLSTDHTPGNLRKIAENVGAVANRAFDVKTMQRSDPIHLDRAGKYYFELLHKENFGAAHVAVGWQLPDGTLQRPLPADHLLLFPIESSWNPHPRQTAPLILFDYEFLPVPILEDITAEEGQPAVFRVTVEATQPAAFQWFRNGVPMESENLSVLRLPAASQADNGAQYSVRISNALGAVTSHNVTLTVQPDLAPPALLSAATRGNPNGLDVRFSEAVSEVTATNPSHYQIAPGVTVTGAQLVANDTVRLTTSTIGVGAVYTLTVNGVRDRAAAGNLIAPNSQLTFLQVQGVLTERTYRDIPGPLLTDLTSHPRYPNQPDAVTFPTSFETIPLRRDNYGVRFQGYLTPPVTGAYTFHVSSRNQSALFLSPNDNPSAMVEIARESAFSTTPRNWETPRPDGLNISAPQMLEAGRRYYIEALFKAAARPGADFLDHFAVTWQKPGDPPPANGDPPIPGEFLSSISAFGPVNLVTPPVAQTVTEQRTAMFRVTVDGTPPYTYQWFQDGEPIAGGTNPELIMSEVDLAADGSLITVQVMNAFSQVTSAPAILRVNADTIPPSIGEVIARNVPTIVNVVFSERISREEAETPSNYSIAPGVTITAAELLADERTVTLATSPLLGGVTYTLTVNNIRDRASQPNTIAPNTTVNFSFFATARVTRGLQVLYNFREGSGTTIHDVSGVGTPLNLNIEQPDRVSWLPDGGLAILQETRILSVGPATKINEAVVAAQELTVEAWVKPQNIEQQGPSRIVTISAGPTGPDRNFSLNMGQAAQPADQRSRYTARGSAGTGMPDYFSTPVDSATTDLQHVVFTHNPITGEAFLYIDGVESAAGNFVGTFNQWGLNRDLALGNEAGLLGSGRFWLGELHLVAIYAAALTPGEVQQNYQQGTAVARVTEGLQALYNFQEGTGTTIQDVSGVGLSLNLNIEEPDKVSWLPGGGIEVHAETRILSVSPATKINQASMVSNELTVEAWVKPANVNQQGPARIVTVSQGPTNPDRNFSLNQGRFGEPEGQRDRWSGRLSEGSNLNPGDGTLSSPHGTATTDLQHVVFTVAASGASAQSPGNAIIYVDGVEVVRGTVTGGFADWALGRHLALVNEAGLLGSGRSWLGQLHLVAIYSRALTGVQVQQNFEAGPGTMPPTGFPVVDLVSPAASSTFTAPATIALTAEASDIDGTVALVEFFAGTELVGTVSSPPFTIVWADVPAGAYTLAARATDNDGNSTLSSPVQITVVPQVIGTYPEVVLQNNPVAYWRFQETSGDTAQDETGTHHATLVNQPELDVPGVLGSAIQFLRINGDGTYAEAPHHAALDLTGSLTVEFWLNILEGWSEAFEAIIGKGDDTFQVRREAGTSLLRFDVRGGTGGSATLISSIQIPANEWVHVVAVYDADAGQMRLFINGQQDPNITARSGTAGVNAHGLQIGCNFSGTVYRRFFDGRIDEVAIYNHALSGQQILAHYLTMISVPLPRLQIALTGNNVVIAWPSSFTGFTLRAAETIGHASIVWNTVSEPVTEEGGSFTVRLPRTGQTRYFQLSK
jgi:hypothetical protein